MGSPLTKQEILKEIVKAGKDPVYFTVNYGRISHPQKGTIPFKAYDYQQALLKDYTDYRFNIILKARQLGISTVTAAYVSWLMLFHKEKNILVVATKLQTATNLVKKVKAIIKNPPSGCRSLPLLWITAHHLNYPTDPRSKGRQPRETLVVPKRCPCW